MKSITNTEYEDALANPDNRRMIRSVINRFSHILSQDILDNCALHGLWTCLQRFDPKRGTFLGYLHNCVDWACKREVSKLAKEHHYDELSEDIPTKHPIDDSVVSFFAKECLSCLPSKDRRFVIAYYYHNMNYSEIARHYHCSSEWVGRRIKLALKKMKQRIENGV